MTDVPKRLPAAPFSDCSGVCAQTGMVKDATDRTRSVKAGVMVDSSVGGARSDSRAVLHGGGVARGTESDTGPAGAQKCSDRAAHGSAGEHARLPTPRS